MTREEAIKVLNTYDVNFNEYTAEEIADAIDMAIEALSAEAEPKWNCTANFAAEQLDRLRKMTDEEKLEFLKRFFGMEGDAE